MARRVIRQALIGLVLMVMLPAAGLAASSADARALLRELEREAVAMASPSLPMGQKEQRFRALLRSDFDLPRVAQFVLGRHWRTASPAQRQEFVRLFEDITVDIWVTRFQDYGGERLEVLDVQPIADGFEAITRVRSPSGEATPVRWRLTETPRGLKVTDIVVEGVSMAITHRSEYASVLRTAGGMEGLLGRMQQQVAQSR